MDLGLVQFARATVGDPQWLPSGDLLDALRPMEWQESEQEAAAALIRWWYWEPRVSQAERPFYPGGASRVGFLDWGEKLATIIAEDHTLLAHHGWDHRKMGEQLRQVLDAAAAEQERRTTLQEQRPGGESSQVAGGLVEQGSGVGLLHVRLRAYRGFQSCPFSACVHANPRRPALHSGIEFHLMHHRDSSELRGPGLAWHLISAHCFFGGRGSHLRIDPVALHHFLLPVRSADEQW